MLAAAFGSNLTITFSQQGIIATHINFELIRSNGIVSPKVESIPKNSLCLPWLYIFKLLGKAVGIGRSCKCFIG